MRRRAGWVVGVVVGTALLAACSDAEGDADPGGEASSPGGGASSESSGATETAEVPVVPELPAEALGDDDAAAVAFVEHWVALMNYAFETGDTDPARALSAGCAVCDLTLTDIEATFGQVEPGSWTVTGLMAQPPSVNDLDDTDVVVVSDLVADGEAETVGNMVFGLQRDAGSAWGVSWLGAAR